MAKTSIFNKGHLCASYLAVDASGVRSQQFDIEKFMIEVDIKDVSGWLEVFEDLDSYQSCCHLDFGLAGLQVFRGINVQDISVYNVL